MVIRNPKLKKKNRQHNGQRWKVTTWETIVAATHGKRQGDLSREEKYVVATSAVHNKILRFDLI